MKETAVGEFEVKLTDGPAMAATEDRRKRETLRVHNALTRTKLRQAEKRVAMLTNALSNIAAGEFPTGHEPEEPRGASPGEMAKAFGDAVQRYAEFVLDWGSRPDRLAVVGYVQGVDVYCMDCSRQQKGSMEPVYAGVDFVACAGCAAGMFVE
jgi:hypothetical protein